MKLHYLSLVEFKNHHQLEVELNSAVIAISGLNGVGKTSILDAVHFLCLGKSYFSSNDGQCLNHDASLGGIRARIEDDEMFEVVVRFRRGVKKIIEVNGKPHKRIMDHVGRFFAVVIAPGDIELVYGTNSVRRQWLNQILGQVDHEHLQQLVAYNKLIEHRNKHLKSDRVDWDLIQSIDVQVDPLAQAIYQKRKQFFADFAERIEKYYHELSQGKERIELQYVSQLEHDAYLDLAEASKDRDRVVQRSFVGVHKDEVELLLDGVPLRRFGSQGQIKSALIALKLAEYDFISSVTEKIPFLLLDDIFEKIDDQRAEVLTSIIKNGNFGQIFITDTHPERIVAFSHQLSKDHLHIEL